MALWADASMVISMRMLGLAGFWTMRPAEALAMVVEKPIALNDAALAGARAAWHGQRPDQIASATLKPLARKTRSNRKRLTKAGPQLPGRSR